MPGRCQPDARAAAPQARDSVPWRARLCDRPLRATPTRGGTPRETVPPRRRISVARAPSKCQGCVFSPRREFRDKASHIWIGGGRSVARRINTSLRFSPACWCPLRNKAIFSPPPISRDDARGRTSPLQLGFGLLCRRLRLPASEYPARRRSASRRVSSHFGRIFYRPVFGGIFHGLLNQVFGQCLPVHHRQES